jgi:ferredoxin
MSLGAVDVGVAELRPYHVYSHVGRGTGGYGEPIELEHRWAVAFTLEMDHRRVACAPRAPVVEESARQYAEGARIALVAASWIRRLGYPARAHIDGNYRVIAPLVARDAGLGEIGRMGLLMTPRLGPRVRLGVVTTELPLVADEPGDDVTVLDFCRICKKCAANCPVRAIPTGKRTPVDDGLRWAIDSEACYRYWNVVGTDCATCMRVCPYSHPDSTLHNVVRRAIRSSAAARRVMLWLDDLFYGERVVSRQAPGASAEGESSVSRRLI